MSNFYVTAVKYSSDPAFISHVLVHSPTDAGRFSKGIITSKVDVISQMGKGHTFKTAMYNYSKGHWVNGADIGVVQINNRQYLRTDPDSTSRDNLGNLLLIDELR